jgi:hypothetical protein
VGTLPAGATAIVIRLDGDPTEMFATLHPNGNFVFSLVGENGERYEIVARYPEGDSDPVYAYAELVALPQAFFLALCYFDPPSGFPAQYTYGYNEWVRLEALGMIQELWLMIPWWRPDMTVNITYPGQATNDFIDVGPADPARYKLVEGFDLPPLIKATISIPDGRTQEVTFDRESNFRIFVQA